MIQYKKTKYYEGNIPLIIIPHSRVKIKKKTQKEVSI